MKALAHYGLDRVAVDGVELTLRRAWPRTGRHLLLEYFGPDDQIWAGQWYGEGPGDKLEQVARQTRAAAPHHPVHLLADRGVVVQGEGADRRLTPLARLAAPETARLMAHRAERRAVVRLDDGAAFAKVVPRGKAAAVAHSGNAAAHLGGLRAPRLVSDHPERGVSVWEALAGHSLHELADAVPIEAWNRVGRSLRLLHETVPPPHLPVHGAAEEKAVLATWFERLATFAPEEAARRRRLHEEIGQLLDRDHTPGALIHRDLHDKQLLLDEDGELGWLDFDTLSVGEPAIDLANLSVHLDLRVAQGVMGEAAAVQAAEALAAGYRPETATRRRAGAYAAATRLRLFCLYAFSPGLLGPGWLDGDGTAMGAVLS